MVDGIWGYGSSKSETGEALLSFKVLTGDAVPGLIEDSLIEDFLGLESNLSGFLQSLPAFCHSFLICLTFHMKSAPLFFAVASETKLSAWSIIEG